MNFATYCSWQRSNSIASGWISLTQIVLTIAPELFWASQNTSQEHNLSEPKAQKTVILKSLFATSYFCPTVYFHWQYNSILQCGHVCHIYSTHVSLPKAHDLLKLAQGPLGQNCQHLQLEKHKLAVF